MCKIHYKIEEGANLDKLSVKLLKEKNPFLLSKNESFKRFPEYLIKKGANVNYTDMLGESLLMHCADGGNIELCKLLLENGADINIKDKFGNTAMDYLLMSRVDEYELN